METKEKNDFYVCLWNWAGGSLQHLSFVPFSCPSATFPIHSLQVSLRGVRIKAWQDSKPTSIFAGHWAMAKALHLSINQNETYPQVLLLLIRLCMWKTCLTNWFSLRLEYYEWVDTVIYGTNAIKKKQNKCWWISGLKITFLNQHSLPILIHAMEAELHIWVQQRFANLYVGWNIYNIT